MTSSSNADYSQVLQIARSSQKVQQLIKDLTTCFNIESIEEKEKYSEVVCSKDESKVLEEVRGEFKKDFRRDKKIRNIIKAILPPPEKEYSLSLGVRLLVFQSGWVGLWELVPADDCIVLISVAPDGATEAELYDHNGGRQTTFTFEKYSVLVISGKCSINVSPKSKIVCVVLCMGRDKK